MLATPNRSISSDPEGQLELKIDDNSSEFYNCLGTRISKRVDGLYLRVYSMAIWILKKTKHR